MTNGFFPTESVVFCQCTCGVPSCCWCVKYWRRYIRGGTQTSDHLFHQLRSTPAKLRELTVSVRKRCHLETAVLYWTASYYTGLDWPLESRAQWWSDPCRYSAVICGAITTVCLHHKGHKEVGEIRETREGEGEGGTYGGGLSAKLSFHLFSLPEKCIMEMTEIAMDTEPLLLFWGPHVSCSAAI